MWGDIKVIDMHGHISTPPQFNAYTRSLWANRTPSGFGLQITDELMETAMQRHLNYITERNIDVQLIGPRPVAMMQWEAPFLVTKWTTVTNDVIAQQVRLHPDRFVGVAQLPQNSKLETSNCVAELERCVNELGFVAAYLNPDPGADRQTPGVHTDYWYPLYEAAESLRVPLIVHPSISRDPRIEIIPHNYQYNNVTEEFLAWQLLEHGDVFERFPKLKVVVCHCGGALQRFIPTDKTHNAQRDFTQSLLFDTCAYDASFLRAAIEQKGVDRMLFGTEAPGSGGAVRPDTGKASDDLVPVIDSFDFLSHEDKVKIFNTNVKRVFERLSVPD